MNAIEFKRKQTHHQMFDDYCTENNARNVIFVLKKNEWIVRCGIWCKLGEKSTDLYMIIGYTLYENWGLLPD